MGGSEQWLLQKALGEERDLVTVDLPGFGQNAQMAPIDRIEGFARWVLEDLSRRGISRFDLLGHSMGGMVVQEMVKQAPQHINRLILYGTGPVGVLPGRFEPIEVSMRRAEEEGASATARRISATWFLDLEKAPEYESCAAIAQKSGLPAILAGLAAMRDWTGEAHLPQIACRTLILWGDRDRTYAWPQIERLWRGIPQSALAIAPDCAHAVHSEAPELFNMMVSRFLAEEIASPRA